ncbi:MAG: exodeoxyribonuclease VII small subunit [Planctomycetes bacterium]|jgi:exodeoxyribonuclease VII small subunit|nr:exodeoxyribonuclease VII small subunit [Planctomycetota bacterium]
MCDSPQPTPDESGEAPLTFEQAVEQLERIIDAIESGEVGLEQSLEQYEQGVKLLNRCRTVLDRAEQKIEKLNVGEAGHLEETDPAPADT